MKTHPITRDLMPYNGDRSSSPSELPIFNYDKIQQTQKTWIKPCTSSVIRGLCFTCHRIWGQAMKLCISPLFISFPCAHSKLIVAFRKQMLDQKSYNKLFVSCFLRTDSEHKLLLSMQRFPAWTFCMCSDRIDAVMVCEAQGPPIMRVHYFCWEPSHHDCRRD